MLEKIDNFFKVSKRGSTFSTEIIAGITNFLSLVYVLLVVPSILHDGGVPLEYAFLAATLITVIGTLVAGLYANYPIVIVAAIGTNAIFAYHVTEYAEYSWQVGMAAMFVAGLLFLMLAITGIREMVIRSIPSDLQHAVIAGIGLFITFIGLQNAELVVVGPNLIQLGDIFSNEALLVILGTVVHMTLLIRENSYAIVIGLLFSTIMGIFLGVVILPEKLFEIPSFSGYNFLPAVEGISNLWHPSMAMLIFSILFTNFFDSLGTLLAVGKKTGLIQNGKVEGSRKPMGVDASSTAIGGLIGSGGTTTALESLIGISIGAKTGLTSVVSSLLFFIVLFFAPVITMMNAYVTAPILIVIGGLMATNLSNINFEKIEYGMPAFFTIILMPLLFSIPQGMAIGFLSYTVAMLAKGRWREIPPMLHVLNVVFVFYFIFV